MTADPRGGAFRASPTDMDESLVPVVKGHSPSSAASTGTSAVHREAPAQAPIKGNAAESRKMAPDIQYYNWIVGGSLVLCFNAGYVNALTLGTVFHAPSAHVTGMVAQASHFTSVGDAKMFIQYFVSYICFLTGALVSGVVVQHEAFYLGRMYGRVLLMLAAVWGVALLVESHFDSTVYFVWVCAFSCGLQNGLTSKYSGNALRTTHLTGTTTDLGIALGHIIFQGKNEWWKVQVHVSAITGFFLGGIAGNFAFRRYEHLALLLSICLSSFCGVLHTAYLSYHEHIPFLAVLESKRDIKLHKDRVRGPHHHHHHHHEYSGGGDVVSSLCLSPRTPGGLANRPMIDHRTKLQKMRVYRSDPNLDLSLPVITRASSGGPQVQIPLPPPPSAMSALLGAASSHSRPRPTNVADIDTSQRSSQYCWSEDHTLVEEDRAALSDDGDEDGGGCGGGSRSHNEVLPPPEELPPTPMYEEDDEAAASWLGQNVVEPGVGGIITSGEEEGEDTENGRLPPRMP